MHRVESKRIPFFFFWMELSVPMVLAWLLYQQDQKAIAIPIPRQKIMFKISILTVDFSTGGSGNLKGRGKPVDGPGK
jgi:hypothetical protein